MDREKRRSPAKTPKKSGIYAIVPVSGHQVSLSQMHLFPVLEAEVDGIMMGVLSDGTPYLHLRGLARMCGIDHAALLRLSNNWETEKLKPRGLKIQELLDAQGYEDEFLNLNTADGPTHVYTDKACMAVLEYYAFESEQGANAKAQESYRVLARSSFRNFIYSKCGYDPDRHIPDSWRNFHNRVLANDQIPFGYFSIFRELADLIVHMIKAGCPFDSHTVPDISVGIIWSRFWEDNLYDARHGQRRRCDHVYPDTYPQHHAGPVPAWIYPIGALAEFHTWLHKNYLANAFPKYLRGKVKSGEFLPGRADQLIAALGRPALPAPSK